MMAMVLLIRVGEIAIHGALLYSRSHHRLPAYSRSSACLLPTPGRSRLSHPCLSACPTTHGLFYPNSPHTIILLRYTAFSPSGVSWLLSGPRFIPILLLHGVPSFLIAVSMVSCHYYHITPWCLAIIFL